MRGLDVSLEAVLDLAEEAGRAILAIYGGPVATEMKEDRTPLTAADRASHGVIEAGLRRISPDRPVLSEEGRSIPYAERVGWESFWLVDPLDGTKEFLKRNGEFTVNIALVERGSPVFGVVFAPALGALYWGTREAGAWCRRGGAAAERIGVRRPAPERGLTVVQSRSHPSPELDAYLRGMKVADAISVGSSLKFCAVAEGRADLYARFGPTMEWDTGAGQAVLEAAGGTVVDVDGAPLRYNKEDLHNPFFIARA